jgi:GTPase involved in cell partitioning and DNA repair
MAMTALRNAAAQSTNDLLRREAAAYDPALAAKPHVVVFTKLDLRPQEPLPALKAPEARETLAVSAVANQRLDELKERLWHLVTEARTIQAEVNSSNTSP